MIKPYVSAFFFIPIFDIWTKHLVLNPNNALENIFRN